MGPDIDKDPVIDTVPLPAIRILSVTAVAVSAVRKISAEEPVVPESIKNCPP